MRVEFMRCLDGGYSLGVNLFVHQHMGKFPWHFHMVVDFGPWFMQLTVGKEEPKEIEGEEVS